ncbi:MAG: response regulator [Vampirovibrionales bacterium]
MSSSITAILIDSDPSVRALIRHTLQGKGNYNDSIAVVGETENTAYGYELIRQHHPDLVFLDVTDSKGFEILERIGTYFKDTMVVASGQDLTLDTVMHCMQAGAREYLRRPFSETDITQLIQRHRPSLGRHNRDEAGRLITVFSNKGGLGKTTIAVNTAMALSESTGHPVALIDFNLQLGDIATFLDIQPRQTVADLVKNLARVDEEYLKTSLTPFSSGNSKLFVLADPTDFEEADDITPDQLATLVAMLKATFPYVVVDLGSSIDSRSIAVLDQSDTILLTSMMNLPCIRNTQRMLNLFKQLGYDAHKIKLIINRYVPNDEITLEDIEKTLKKDIFWQFPNNYFAVIASINRGIPLRMLDNGRDLYNSFLSFSRQLAGYSDISVPNHSSVASSYAISKDSTPFLGKPKGFGLTPSSPKATTIGEQNGPPTPSLWGLLGKSIQQSFSKYP